MTKDLQIYVWYDFESSNCEYGGLAVAVADSAENAILEIQRETSTSYNEKRWGKCTTYPLEPSAFVCRGAG